MSFFTNISEKITQLKKLLGKDSTSFLAKDIVWSYLNKIDLSSEECNILHSSFRTRIKLDSGNFIFQFRISDTSIPEEFNTDISDFSESLKSKLEKIIPDTGIIVQIKISNCCQSNCVGCETYEK